MEKWKQEMQEAHEIVRENAKKAAERSKKHYDGKVRSSVLCPGDRVLVRNLTPRGGTGKLRNHWEQDIHVVIRQVAEGLPVYEVKPEQGRGRSRTMHRNLLLPCDYLPLETEPKAPPKQEKRRVKETETENADQKEEDEEEEWVYCYKPVIHSQMPHADGVIERADTQQDSGQEKQNLSDDELIEGRLIANTDEPETQQENVPQEENYQDRDESLVEKAVDEIPAFQHPEPPGGEKEQTDGAPRRERRAPKVFTYDQLGTPTCYSTAYGNERLYQHQPIQYQHIRPVTLWTNPFQTYQPISMQGY
ncbi:uncharacterized protein LOC115791517 [Archocentrus centrarchus]|uniref:uncharacterized protein LOC115791517 n=1 Tax=Archocentrus centrarchus TaxID=63155 RepID=UPI0011EA40BB|nr:uncharacterized protein LOC115791517 [Archocentrus centrarchus]